MNLGYRIPEGEIPILRALELGLSWVYISYVDWENIVYFWGCSPELSEPLPEGFFSLGPDPMKYAGFGIPESEAEMIKGLLRDS